MREIKFRAWFKGGLEFGQQYKGMYSVIAINWEEGFVTVKRSSAFAQQIFILDAVELMQFTRLKDKNDKEIYEGDIVKVYNWGYETSKDVLGITEITWDVDEKGWRYNPSLNIDDVYDQFRNVEVIGNIYENPELLKEK